MKPADPAAQSETLLEHGPFVRRIARSLLFDEHRVDDVVQETWLAAIERPPRGVIRSWLGTVVRNFSLRALRGESRRARRELAAARPEAVPSTEEIAARESARRTVVEAVLALDEPFRSAILLRFYEGLPPRTIARRLGIPVETARSRVKRGVELLRARLDGEHRGGRRSWCLALVPLALPRPVEAAGLLALGSIAMSSASKIGIAAALAVGAFVALRSERTRESDAPRADARPEVAVAAASGVRASGRGPARESDPLPEAAPAPKRSPVGGDLPPTEPAPVVSPPAAAVGVVFGRVTDGAGTPVSGAEVHLLNLVRRVNAEGGEVLSGVGGVQAVTKTDPEGLYRFEVPKGGPVTLIVSRKGYEQPNAHRRVPDPPYEERIDFVLRRESFAAIRGRLLDLLGAPLPADEIRFLFPPRGADPRPPQGVSGIWALESRRLSAPEPERYEDGRARIDAERATFEIDAPAHSGRPGWGWLVTACLRGELITEKSWKEGDPEVEFRLDPAALRASLGALEVRGVDAASRTALPLSAVLLRRPADPYGYGRIERPGEGSVQVEGLRTGTYEVAARAEGYAEGAARVEARRGETTVVEIPLGKPAAVRLRLVPVEGWSPEIEPKDLWKVLSCFDAEGRSLGCRSESETTGEETFLRILDAPTGGCWVVLEGNALRLELSSGGNPDRDFPIHRPRLLKARFLPAPSAFGPGGSLRFVQRLLLEGVVPVRVGTAHGGADKGGWATSSFEAPPGRYTLELLLPGGPPIRREISIGDEPITEISLEGR
ncbi:MAG: sigma-70 family RNA polymerase sigma factor [Planctomycetes bacterium]|nr:sigma-70 family RNA polymerase sigma factor [Planctomycetota bacterium]